ncbi:MAG: phage baseplate assembly protein V [Firmicutes bacterium]|nr:phage baseplate assembly protein V [Bacillota bacterium]
MSGIWRNLIRIGRVSAVDPARATARVVFEAQEVVSYDLPVIQRQTLRNKDYYLPDVGEHVVCIFLPTGNADGFILGAIYTDEDQLPASSQDKRVIQFEDGTRIEYDRASHTLTVNAVGPINIVAAGNVNVTGDVIADGISLKSHVHPKNDSGGPTGPPQ